MTVFGSSRYVVMGYTQNALNRLDACNDRNKKKNNPAVMHIIQVCGIRYESRREQ